MNEKKFFRCNICGNLVEVINDSNVPMVCCGQPMTKLVANTADASLEKHVPKVDVNGRLVYVEVGSLMHPFTVEHHIEFIYLLTKKGCQRKAIAIGSEPKAMFAVIEDEVVAVYAYCNIHGLWKTDVIAKECACGHDNCDC